MVLEQFIDKVCAHHAIDAAALREQFEAAMLNVAAAADHTAAVVRYDERAVARLECNGEPLRDPELLRAVELAVTDVFHRWFPWEPPAAGSVGRLMCDDGDWLCGLRGSSGGATLEIVSASLTPRAVSANSTWLDYSMTFSLRRGADASTYTARGGDHSSNCLGFELPASRDSVPLIQETLGAMAEDVSAKGWMAVGGLSGWPLEILAAAQSAPRPDSLLVWCRDTLLESLLDEPLTIATANGHVRIDKRSAELPDAVFSGFRQGWLNVLALSYDTAGTVTDVVEAAVGVGHLTAASHRTHSPDAELAAWASRLRDVWRERVKARVAAVVSEHGLSALGWSAIGVDILRLVEFSNEHGLPPEPPVPAFSEDAFAQGAAKIAAPTVADLAWIDAKFGDATAVPMAAHRFGSYLLIFGADRSRPPHYVSEIWLRSDFAPDEAVQVLLTDVWNPATRWSIDGDAFAFRRFTQWLVGVLNAAGVDQTYRFAADEDQDEEPIQLSLAEWLAFDGVDDAEPVDWRCENYVVAAGHPLDGAAAMFGFEAEFVKRLVSGSPAAIWRRFLAEFVHPSFGR